MCIAVEAGRQAVNLYFSFDHTEIMQSLLPHLNLSIRGVQAEGSVSEPNAPDAGLHISLYFRLNFRRRMIEE
jgi:hypothetical protein